MNTRREIKSKHEAAVINAAVCAHNATVGCAFRVESMPEPPDAVLVDGSNRVWLEHTDAFYPGWAEDITSYAASDKVHRPMRKGPHRDMDNCLADVFADVVNAKINNNSYRPFIEKYGPGILVVGLESPWLDEETLQAIDRKWSEVGSPDLLSIFKWFYLGFRVDGKNIAIPWNPVGSSSAPTGLFACE